MSNPSFFECIYEAVLDIVTDVNDLLARTTNLGNTYVDDVIQQQQQEQKQNPSVLSQWIPKMMATNASQAPVTFTRSAVLGALRSGCINFVRIGGISGFLAVALSAYAAHAFAKGGGDSSEEEDKASGTKSPSGTGQSGSRSRTPKSRTSGGDEDDPNGNGNGNGNGRQFSDADKQIFYTANLFHFVHSLALLATPVFKCPNLTGLLMTAGMAVFCGSCYVRVFTGNKDVSALTPYGGVLLLVGWMTMIF